MSLPKNQQPPPQVTLFTQFYMTKACTSATHLMPQPFKQNSYEINQPEMLRRIEVKNINSCPKYLRTHRTLPLANEVTSLLAAVTLVVLLFQRTRSGALLVVLPVVQIFQRCVDALQNGLVLPVLCNTNCRFWYMHLPKTVPN